MKLQITIEGKTYAVDVEVLEDAELPHAPSHAPHHAASPSFVAAQSYGAGWDSEGNICRSPLMGLAITVNAKPGQSVHAGEVLLVLEAMKMETNITAPRNGTVKNVFVTQGDSVKRNQILVELE